MDTLTAIHTRRSVRSFTDERITPDHLKTMLDAAMAAPSAGNAQPWEFIVVDDANILASVPAIHPYAGMMATAPMGILVCADPSREKHTGFWVQDCSAAIQNLLLAAFSLGLGTVWTGIYPVEDRVAGFRDLFALPETIIPFGMVAVGHPKTEQTYTSRYDTAKIHHNGWK